MFKSDTVNRYFKLGVVTFAAGAIYPLLYLRIAFQTPLLEIFGMDVATLGEMYTILGIMYLVGYVPSGWLADRFSSKILLFISLMVTGLAGIWFAQVPSANMVKIIFLIWGVSCVFTFWSAHMKIVKLLAKKDEQGKFFGILDGGKGLVEAILATIVVAVFSMILAKKSDTPTRDAMVTVIYIYSIISIITSFIVLAFLEDKKESEDEVKEKIENVEKESFIKRVIKTLSIPEVWFMIATVFCGYTVYWTVYYFGGYLKTTHDISVVMVGYVATIILWMRPVGGFLGGYLGDKFGRPNVIMGSIALTSAGLLTLAFLGKGVSVIFICVLVILIALMQYFIRGLYWSLLDYCKIPTNMLGFGIGIISFLAYTPDILIPKLSGPVFTRYNDGPEAYAIYFIASACLGVFGIVAAFILSRRVKKHGE